MAKSLIIPLWGQTISDGVFLAPFQGRNQVFFLGETKPMGGHNLPPMVEIGLTYHISENLGIKAAA